MRLMVPMHVPLTPNTNRSAGSSSSTRETVKQCRRQTPPRTTHCREHRPVMELFASTAATTATSHDQYRHNIRVGRLATTQSATPSGSVTPFTSELPLFLRDAPSIYPKVILLIFIFPSTTTTQRRSLLSDICRDEGHGICNNQLHCSSLFSHERTKGENDLGFSNEASMELSSWRSFLLL